MECNCFAQSSENSLSLWISIIAIVISVVAIMIEKSSSRSQLRIDFFSDHFRDALSNKIPDARKKIKFQNERMVGCEELQNTLAEMRRGSDYFKYASPRFYKKFVEANQDVEDYFIDGLNRNYGESRQKEFLEEGDRKLRRLYKIINRKYFG